MKEIAELMGCFEEISFVDNGRVDAVGKLEEIDTFYSDYIYTIVACDDVDEGLETLSIIPVLAHLNSTVSPSAGLNSGSSVEPKAVVGCESEIGFATVIGTNTVVEPYCFIGDGGTFRPETIVKSTSMISMGTETEQGTVLFTSLDNKQ